MKRQAGFAAILVLVLFVAMMVCVFMLGQQANERVQAEFACNVKGGTMLIVGGEPKCVRVEIIK